MKFSLTFKTPGVTDQLEADEDAVKLAEKFLDQWLEWHELITVDFDTDAKTATVRKSG